MKKISVGTLILALFIPLLIGGISAALSSQGMAYYANMDKPPLSPPAWVFPIAWTVLYLMMGMASYFIFTTDTDNKNKAMALRLYAAQLAMNFMWSILFFSWSSYLLAFFWLILMLCLVIFCAGRFYKINRNATYLFVPYIIWLIFAAYLNMGAYLLNM